MMVFPLLSRDSICLIFDCSICSLSLDNLNKFSLYRDSLIEQFLYDVKMRCPCVHPNSLSRPYTGSYLTSRCVFRPQLVIRFMMVMSSGFIPIADDESSEIVPTVSVIAEIYFIMPFDAVIRPAALLLTASLATY